MMSKEEIQQQHDSVKNIEQQLWGFKPFRILSICLLFITTTGTIVNYVNKLTNDSTINNIEIRNDIKDLKKDFFNQVIGIKRDINDANGKDSLRYLTISNKMEANHENINNKVDKLNGKINSIDYRVKHLELGAVTEKRINGRTVFVPLN